jgi:hypothetical protein
MERTFCRGLLRHMVANGALVYPSQGGRYRAEGCKALGTNNSVVTIPLGNQDVRSLSLGAI